MNCPNLIGSEMVRELVADMCLSDIFNYDHQKLIH